MGNKRIGEFMKLVDAKFASQTPNGPDDQRRLTVGLDPDWYGLLHRTMSTLDTGLFTGRENTGLKTQNVL